MFDDFDVIEIPTDKATIHGRKGGSGPPVLLLHGHPQTHVMWHLVAPRLAERFTVVATDLRGYGDSSKPPTTSHHEPYSKRAMARDQVEVMHQLGFDRFSVAGHDRGGRCAYRMALDHSDRIEALAVLDIIPTGEAWRHADMLFGLENWHWFFLAQPYDVPERLIGSDPDAFYLRKRESFAAEALAEYLRCVHDRDTIHAMCEDYRAGASIDRELDETDRGTRLIRCPVLVLWSGRDVLHRRLDPLAVWRKWADHVEGHAIDCGHYLAEEEPDETYEALSGFLAGSRS
jgi:haloacetate dehalogenase